MNFQALLVVFKTLIVVFFGVVNRSDVVKRCCDVDRILSFHFNFNVQ